MQIPVGGVPPAIVVSEFFAHGQLRPDATNLAVSDGKHRPVPWRILQAGPGDFCRVAFQAAPGQRSYRIDYGGRAEPVQVPEWTSSLGLVLETRRWRSCDLDSFESLRTAFEEAEPISSDYVPAVYHRSNPIAPAPETRS